MMPKKDRFHMALILGAGGAIIASGATAPATIEAKKPPNGKTVVQAAGLDWEKVSHIKKPPNG